MSQDFFRLLRYRAAVAIRMTMLMPSTGMEHAFSTLVRRKTLIPVSRDAGSRAVDLTVGFVILIFILPLLLGIAVTIYVLDSRPTFFVQQRVGRDGAMFPCLKFGSMAVDANLHLENFLVRNEMAQAERACDQKLRSNPQITPFGAFLRRSSFDELPQIFNFYLAMWAI
jgi:exopolysaccharide production protein ExoY